MTWVQSDDLGIAFGGALSLHTIGALTPQARDLIAEHSLSALRADLRQVEHLDTAGAVFLRDLPDLARSLDKELRLDGLPAHLQPVFDFATPAPPPAPPAPPRVALERLGAWVRAWGVRAAGFLYLMADLSVFSVAPCSGPRVRRGSFLVSKRTRLVRRRYKSVGLVLFSCARCRLQSQPSPPVRGPDIFVANPGGHA